MKKVFVNPASFCKHCGYLLLYELHHGYKVKDKSLTLCGCVVVCVMALHIVSSLGPEVELLGEHGGEAGHLFLADC